MQIRMEVATEEVVVPRVAAKLRRGHLRATARGVTAAVQAT